MKYFNLYLCLILSILSISFIIILIFLNILPNLYLIIGIVIFLNIIAYIFSFSKRKWLKIIGLFICILLSIGLVIGIYYGQSTLSFLKKSFIETNEEVTTYNVLVHGKTYKNIKDIKNKSLGYFQNDKQYKESLNHINVKINNKSYDDLINMYDDLINGKTEALVIDTGYISVLEDYFTNLKKDTKVIYSFKINKKIKKNYKTIKKIKPVNIYVSGSDSRDDTINEKSRTDVNMILTINPQNKTILVTSIPRDYYVNLYNTSGLKDKLTHSGIYGIETSAKTIEKLLDINIDYYIKINFKSVISLVDLVGGIDIYSDTSFKTHCGDGGATVTYVKEGINHFSGPEALSYARERYAYKDGDKHRMQNTQQVFKATFDKIMSDKALLFKYDKVLNSFQKLYSTNIPSEYVKLLVKKQISNMGPWQFTLTQLGGTGAKMNTYSMPNYKSYVMIPNEEDIKNASENIKKVYLN